MNILSVNAGSSSLKFQVLVMPEETVLTSGIIERMGLKKLCFQLKLLAVKSVSHNPS